MQESKRQRIASLSVGESKTRDGQEDNRRGRKEKGPRRERVSLAETWENDERHEETESSRGSHRRQKGKLRRAMEGIGWGTGEAGQGWERPDYRESRGEHGKV